MKKLGLTGVIGSGKTTAANYFKDLGAPVFIADDSAKDLMTNDPVIRHKMVDLLGESTYIEGKLNKDFVSDKIFSNKELLDSVNKLIHPKVHEAFFSWFKNQNFKYIVYEAALIFENNSEHIFDKIICIKTPLNIIHERIKNRERYSKNRVNIILKSQLDQELKCSKSDFCIENISRQKLYDEIKKIHSSFL